MPQPSQKTDDLAHPERLNELAVIENPDDEELEAVREPIFLTNVNTVDRTDTVPKRRVPVPGLEADANFINRFKCLAVVDTVKIFTSEDVSIHDADFCRL